MKKSLAIVFIPLSLLVLLLAAVACRSAAENRFEAVYAKYRAIATTSTTSYSERFKHFDNLIKELREFLKNHTRSSKRIEAERILKEIKTMQRGLYREYRDFQELEKSIDTTYTGSDAESRLEYVISRVKTFLSKYPDSLKQEFLNTRLDQLILKKYKEMPLSDTNPLPKLTVRCKRRLNMLPGSITQC